MSLINSSRIEALIHRLDALDENQEPRFGKMTASTLLDHLASSLEIAVGKRCVKALLPLWLATILRPLMHLPIPRYMSTTPEFLKVQAGDFQTKLQAVQELLRLFHREVLTNPIETHVHPIFGEMNRMRWAKLQDSHFEHHFKQFSL